MTNLTEGSALAKVISATWAATPVPGLRRKDRRSCHYEAYIPDRLADLELLLPPDVAADVSDAERAVARLNTGEPALASLEALARLLLRAESIASSRIEGLEVGGRRLARAAAAEQLGEVSTDVTADSVLANITAMATAVDDVAIRQAIDTDAILAIHRALMTRSDRPELAGQVRSQQNWIGGSDHNPCSAEFVPPPPELVPELLTDLAAFLDDDRYPPVVQAALAHAQFETIHPFADGNGRTGRALIHVVLRRRGLAPRYVPPISLVLATQARTYIGGLTAFRYRGPASAPAAQGGIGSWVATFAAACHRAAEEASAFSAHIDDLQSSWRGQLGPVRGNSAADLLLREVLPAAPILTVGTAVRLTGRSAPAVNAAIGRLVAAGVLRQTTAGRRNRAFEAVGLLDELTRFERGLASPTGDTRTDSPVRRVPYRPAP